MKKMRENWHRDGLIKCPGACPGDVYFNLLQARAAPGFPATLAEKKTPAGFGTGRRRRVDQLRTEDQNL